MNSVRERKERKILSGIKEYLKEGWQEESPTAKAYAEALDTLTDKNFSSSLHKRIFRKFKSLEGVCNIEEIIERDFGEEGKDVVNTSGYPESAEEVQNLVKKLKSSTDCN